MSVLRDLPADFRLPPLDELPSSELKRIWELETDLALLIKTLMGAARLEAMLSPPSRLLIHAIALNHGQPLADIASHIEATRPGPLRGADRRVVRTNSLFRAFENVSQFNKTCQQLGLPDSDLLSASDLKNPMQFRRVLSSAVLSLRCDPPPAPSLPPPASSTLATSNSPSGRSSSTPSVAESNSPERSLSSPQSSSSPPTTSSSASSSSSASPSPLQPSPGKKSSPPQTLSAKTTSQHPTPPSSTTTRRAATSTTIPRSPQRSRAQNVLRESTTVRKSPRRKSPRPRGAQNAIVQPAVIKTLPMTLTLPPQRSASTPLKKSSSRLSLRPAPVPECPDQLTESDDEYDDSDSGQDVDGDTVFSDLSHRGLRDGTRSEERRVGKECRSRWSPYH